MAQNLADYLYRAAIRMLRSNWPETRPFAEEWYTILRGIDRSTTGPISFTPDGGDPVEFPEVDDLNIPPFDLDFPEDGTNSPETTINGGTTTEETYFWHRAIFPGKITSYEGDGEYAITLHPNGELVTESEGHFGFAEPGEPATKDIEARVIDTSLAGAVPINSWVYVYYVAEYLLTEETHRNSDGEVISRTTDLTVVQEDFLFVPGNITAGKVAKVTTAITGRSDLTPGQGQAVLLDFTPATIDPTTGEEGDPSLAEGETIDVYNMVTGEIAVDEFIQVKRIDNAWWADAQDCGA